MNWDTYIIALVMYIFITLIIWHTFYRLDGHLARIEDRIATLEKWAVDMDEKEAKQT